jgi:hypothetical protein
MTCTNLNTEGMTVLRTVVVKNPPYSTLDSRDSESWGFCPLLNLSPQPEAPVFHGDGWIACSCATQAVNNRDSTLNPKSGVVFLTRCQLTEIIREGTHVAKVKLCTHSVHAHSHVLPPSEWNLIACGCDERRISKILRVHFCQISAVF